MSSLTSSISLGKFNLSHMLLDKYIICYYAYIKGNRYDN